MLAIIDMDTLVYRAAGAAQHKDPETKELIVEPLENALSNAKNLMMKILEKTGCNDYQAFLTESSPDKCFRTKLYPEYKANRRGKDRPVHYKAVREYYINHWDATVVEGIEADDAVCMLQYETYKGEFETEVGQVVELDECPGVLVGIDKDLLQIPGLHYNYVKDEWQYITALQGLKAFYTQLLVGDPVDNIPRVKKGWRSKKYEEYIEACDNEKDMFLMAYSVVEKEKNLFIKKEVNDYLEFVGNLLYLKKTPEDKWESKIDE